MHFTMQSLLLFFIMFVGSDASSGCCVTFGYGSMMKPCCFQYSDDINQTSCVVDENMAGQGKSHYPDQMCEYVQAGCCVHFGYGSMMKPCCHTYEDSVLPDSCETTMFGEGVTHYPSNTCLEVQAFTSCEVRRKLETNQCSGRYGCDVVTCESDGTFSPTQCRTTGYCRCVDSAGQTIDGTELDTREQPNCALGCCQDGDTFDEAVVGELCKSVTMTHHVGKSCTEVKDPSNDPTGCCVAYGIGSLGEECCHQFQDDMTDNTCGSNELFGQGSTFHVGKMCNTVKHEQNLTLCLAKRASDEANCGGVLGCFITECLEDGSFNPKQCFERADSCWCVDEFGDEIPETSSHNSVTTLDCQQGCCMTFGYGTMMKPCCHEYEDAVLPSFCEPMGFGGGSLHFPGNTCEEIKILTNCEKTKKMDEDKCGGLDGCFITDCSSDGSFNSIQCHGSGCWCVDGNGMNIANTTTHIRNKGSMECESTTGCCVTFGYGAMMKPCCHKYEDAILPTLCEPKGFGGGSIHYPGASCSKIQSQTDCERRQAVETAQCSDLLAFGIECFITECETDGTFKASQCDSRSCWCVDSVGRFIDGSNSTGQLSSDLCATGCCKIEEIYQDDVLGTICSNTTNGNFFPSKSCLEISTELSSCLIRQRIEESQCNGLLGCFKTQCKEDGSFELKQCHGSFCWCVDTHGNEIVSSKTSTSANCVLDCETYKSPCQKKLEADESECGVPPRPGCFITQCLEDGSFNPIQCSGSTGFCWCVDKSGTEILETSTRDSALTCNTGCCMSYGYGSLMEPCCHNYQDDVVEQQCVASGLGGSSIHYPNRACQEIKGRTQCEMRKEMDNIKCGEMMGCFITQCELDGSFSSKQCHGSTGFCWCVDGHGQVINNTRTAPDSESDLLCMGEQSTCEIERNSDISECGNKFGCFITQCEEDGSFMSKQCHASTGYCWCVDADGQELENTASRDTPLCESRTDCQLQKSADIRRCNGNLGCFITQCLSTGEFSPQQSDPSGYHWCVDASGKKIESTVTRESSLNCEICAQKRRVDESNCGGVGCFKTRCTADCCFEDKQCFGSVCWCVDSAGNSINDTYDGIWKDRSCACERQRSDDMAKCNGRNGCFITQCLSDGSFKSEQCHGSVCWCVDSNGMKLDFTGSRYLDCSTPCIEKRMSDTAACDGKMGCFITQCEDDGSFSVKQSHGSQSWCVNSLGVEINNTMHGFAHARDCICDRQRSDDESQCGGFGCFKTRCETDGSFSLTQCHGSSCWCVDSFGKEIGRKGSMDVICTTTCELQRSDDESKCGGFGCKTTQCETDGSFSATQCFGSSCWCVDSVGEEISQTTHIPGQFPCECFRRQSDDDKKCNGMLGCPMTRCESDGTFSAQQCHGSVCWCVDSYGNEVGVTGNRDSICNTPCLGKQAMDKEECDGMLGCRMTQCEDDGSFSPRQSHGSKHWCVDFFGIPITNTTRNIWEPANCACFHQQSIDDEACGGIGCFKTQCLSDGSFSPRQCHGSECHCVGPSGEKLGIEGERSLICGETCMRRQAEDQRVCDGRLGCFITECDSDESFKPVQCLGSRCWCVDFQGEEIVDTEHSIGTQLNCACYRKQMEDKIKCSSIGLLKSPMKGCFITKCESDGSFSPTQCLEDICWCVSRDGAPVEDTLQLTPKNNISCTSLPSTCELKLLQNEIECEGMVGCFLTSCATDGSYSPQQCFGSECWCVDTEGIQIENTVRSIGVEIDCDCFREHADSNNKFTYECDPTIAPNSAPTLQSSATQTNIHFFGLVAWCVILFILFDLLSVSFF